LQVSRIDLSLIPTHPDRVCGLGFLSNTVYAFTPDVKITLATGSPTYLINQPGTVTATVLNLKSAIFDCTATLRILNPLNAQIHSDTRSFTLEASALKELNFEPQLIIKLLGEPKRKKFLGLF
jgi:hypothetical protein